MTKYPLEGGSWSNLRPTLTSIPVPPIFLLRPVTERDRRRLRKLAIQEVWRSTALLICATRRWLACKTYGRRRCSRNRKAASAPIGMPTTSMKRKWAASKSHPRSEHPDLAMMVDLSERITRAWPPLPKMIADNNEYDETWPKLIASIVIADGRTSDFRYERDEGVVPLDCPSIAWEASSLISIRRSKATMLPTSHSSNS